MARFAALLLPVLCLSPAAAAAGERPNATAGLEWLADRQSRDGSWGTHDKLAVTAMSGMALLASGSTPERGRYDDELRRAVEFVLRCQEGNQRAFQHRSSGYSAIHNHGYALLFLTQCYGEGGPLDPRVRAAIERGINATVASQFDNGGFGYFLYRDRIPTAHRDMWRDDEASTTISQIQALRGARNAGFSVPRRALERAEEYVADSQHEETGGFLYSIGSDPPRVSFVEGSDRPTFAITAAASAVLHALGTYEGRRVERGIDYLEGFIPPYRRDIPFFYYGHYYAAQVMHMVGGARGRRWLDAVYAELTARQHPDGYWPPEPDDSLDPSDSRLLNTAWCLQICQIEKGLLPVHER